MHHMTTNQHSILEVHATTTANAPVDLIDSLNNVANATTTKNSLINIQAATIKSQQLTIAEPTTISKLQSNIESLTKNQLHSNKSSGAYLNAMGTVGCMATASKRTTQAKHATRERMDTKKM